MSTPLERQLTHYVAALLTQATYRTDRMGTHVQLDFNGTQLYATAHTHEAAGTMLGHKLQRYIFDSMNRSRPLPTVNGIDINPGSC